MNELLKQPVSILNGVGEKRQEALNELGIHTIEDLMTHYPFRYEDLSVKAIDELEDKEKTSLKGTVVAEPVVSHFGYRKSRLNFRIATNEKMVIPVTFFNQTYLKKKITAGQEIIVQGIWDARYLKLTGSKILTNEEQNTLGNMEPIYRVNKKIKQHTLIQLIEQVVGKFKVNIQDPIPLKIREKFKLLHYADAIEKMHFPASLEELKQARRTLIFDELFLYQLKIQLIRKKERTLESGLSILYDVQKLKEFINSFPFELTDAQKRSINDICRDLRKPVQMNRLLQGDVGSGKTAVAAAALFAVASTGMQGALMAPTEILAEQHMKNLQDFFESFDIRTALLTSSVKPKEKKEIYARIFEGQVDIVIGTHALIQDGIDFNRLGIVITDEQHRFGVEQRRKLSEKGIRPDILAMTATPIPRTLAITVYGEMDVSILDELPAGRKPIKTNWVRPGQEDAVFAFVQKQLNNGSQVYIVSPLIEESEKMDLKNVTDLKNKYASFFGPHYRTGLLHGKLSAEEKEEVMLQFKRGHLNILVSTTVIEVGVDVPNATLIVIYDADRFGLAQLHQLRGRVGRGGKASFCILIADPKGENGQERMKIMTQTNDGFVLSEKDLELRGSGDIFGKKQSGIPDFKIADIISDGPILEAARQEAIEVVLSNEMYESQEFALLRQYAGIKPFAVG